MPILYADSKVRCPLCEKVYRLGDIAKEPDKVVTCPACQCAVQGVAKQTAGAK